MDVRCEVAGLFLDEVSLWIDAPCNNKATVRYRAANDTAWKYRCSECAQWPDRSLLVIEDLERCGLSKCTDLATHRYELIGGRTTGYRCTPHAAYLDRRHVRVEKIGEAS